MKQVKFRSVLLLLLIVLLGLGLALFCLRYTFRGEAWASFSANGHAYTDGVVRTGQVLDRNGTVLYDGPSGVYHEDSALRQATLHAVGDQLGNISTSALEAFQSRLIGFDPLTGTLSGGHKVYLTIDADLSRTAWEALDGRKGVAAVYNYQTGDILCMVSNPSFDPADPPEISDDDSDYEGVYLNRLLSGLYTPGSVFKVVTTAAALEQLPGVEERTFTCDGSVTIGDQVITCPYAHGEMDLSDAFARSCNGVYAQLAVELGADVLQDYARQAGLLEGFSVSGIPTVSGLFTAGSGGDLGWSGVGQYEDMVNPCAMLALMGLIPNPPGVIKSGQIRVNGIDMRCLTPGQLSAVRGSEIAMIFQDPMTSLNPVMTVGEQIQESLLFHRDITRKEAWEQAKNVLATVGIDPNRAGEYPHQFSGGMRQRVGIAIALACRPAVLIADEPTTALDVTIQDQVLRLMRDLREQYETSMILITHDLGVVAEICDEVAVMYGGRIVESGTLEDIFNHTMHPYTEGLFNSLPNIHARVHKLTPIPGLMPDPSRLPEGCTFAERCPYATARCRKEQPAFMEASSTHRVACCRYQEGDFHIKRGN